MNRTIVTSPIGDLGLVSDDENLIQVAFADRLDHLPGEMVDATSDPVLAGTAEQLSEYFAGELQEFDLPVDARGTAFQRRVWRQLLEIPYGETWSYGEVASALGLSARASRAVGLANGANPIPVVVPCHRVIGATGKLVGYGGGLDRKQLLLTLEMNNHVPTTTLL